MVTLWNPIQEMRSMRDAVTQLLDQAFVRPSAVTGFAGNGATIPFDVAEQRDAVMVRAAVPGLDPASIELTVQQGMLTLAGRRTLYDPEASKQYIWHLRGLTEGQIRFSVALPVKVDADQAQASYDYGIITVHLPKAEAIKPKQIQITAGQGQKQLAAATA
jgi:HSP20 family protein